MVWVNPSPRFVELTRRTRIRVRLKVGLYKILFGFWAFMHEPLLFFAHPPFVQADHPHPVIAHTIAQYNVPPRPPVIATYTTQYWQWQYRVKAKLKVPCAPKWFSGSFSYSTCTNDFGAVTHNERRFQFRLFNHLFRIAPGFMGKSRINRWWSRSELETEIRSGTWAKRFHIWRLLSSCGAPLNTS